MITSSLVNKHYNNPHTLLIFSSQSTKMAEVEVLKSSGLPASLFGMKKRLVMVHIGRDIQIGRSEDRMRADRAEVLDLPVE